MDDQDKDLADQCLDLLININLQISEVNAYAIEHDIVPTKMRNMDGTFVMSTLLHAKAMTLNALSLLK